MEHSNTHDLFSGIAEQLAEKSAPTTKQYIGMEQAAKEAVFHLIAAMFPSFFGEKNRFVSEAQTRTQELIRAMDALTYAMEYVSDSTRQAKERSSELISRLPSILDDLNTDITAAYQGDPAATGFDEIILTYPAFKTIAIFRIAHQMYLMGIPVLPRMLTEYAHRKTGIDIHPGATIGRYFFIDHGTGVVIGETTTIGEHVKLYQNVTLGAKSFACDEDGTLIRGAKRHPDIGNNVVIYAGATILGGQTRIGDNCVVGGNVWLTHSLEANQTITI